MYQSVITFKDDLPPEELSELFEQCEKAFDNHAGKAACRIELPNRFVAEGVERFYCCLNIGIVDLYQTDGFVDCVDEWLWFDEDPEENHSVLESLAEPVY